MPSENNPTDPNPPDSGNPTPAPGSSLMSRGWIAAVAIYLVIVSIVVLYGLIKLWPYPTPSGQAKTESSASQPNPTISGNEGKGAATPTPTELPDPAKIYFFQGRLEAQVYLETRLLLLVMLSGALGSLMHSLRSLYWYTGNRMMVWSWVAFYLLLPVTGAILAIIFYFVVRGGFFSSTASFETTSPYGFAALSALVGLFSPQATLKLKEIAETIFSKAGAGTDNKPQEIAETIFSKAGAGTDNKPQETSAATPAKPAPTIARLDRTSGSANDSVVITGAAFSEGVGVKFGGVIAVVSASSDTTITAVVPENPSASAPVDVQVTNSDGQSVTAQQKFSYVAGGDAGTTDEGTTDELEGDDEIKSNTTDEELPITEGGVG